MYKCRKKSQTKQHYYNISVTNFLNDYNVYKIEIQHNFTVRESSRFFLIKQVEHVNANQGVALTGRNRTGPPCSVGRPTAHAPGGRPARQPAALQTTTDNRRQRTKQYWPKSKFGGNTSRVTQVNGTSNCGEIANIFAKLRALHITLLAMRS